MNGIYTLANDKVYDQLVAFLNSIEANVGPDFPVCIIPFDDQLDQVKAEIANRPNVTLFDDQSSINRWDEFTRKIWDLHPTAKQYWYRDHLISDPNDYWRITMRRKFCAFDGPFDKFVFLDADTLVFDSLDVVFERLDDHDWVVYDFMFRQPNQAFDLKVVRKLNLFTEEQLSKVFCAGFFASHKGFFDEAEMQGLLKQLGSGEITALVPRIPDQTITNYMAIRPGRSICNLAQILPAEQRAGNCVTSPHFENVDGVLFDRGIRLTYVHFICVTSKILTRVAQGENIYFPYRDVYLHYRFLREPEKAPQFPADETPVYYTALRRKNRYQPSPIPWLPTPIYQRANRVGQKVATWFGR
ncbi:Npun_R2821/Npun_R2822 family protein [Leptolyngbya sp. FACHB-261]|uniref:Npun_R2821/Npun_R2822 family protein n=1 Tax=Leptolyngbya sp. FACHB-261 TaxID=2692806 RepID=UPI0016879C8A|nr:Npun_R2821/Npun_R2822 family protein [Leptolyngbya sp. FACHB-261]MBD2099521.1 sugar transferase [Leptolyngbya sp. FACHB-261]